MEEKRHQVECTSRDYFISKQAVCKVTLLYAAQKADVDTLEERHGERGPLAAGINGRLSDPALASNVDVCDSGHAQVQELLADVAADVKAKCHAKRHSAACVACLLLIKEVCKSKKKIPDLSGTLSHIKI